MNTQNNKRRQNSQEKIERAFIKLLQTKEISKITVSEICHMTGLNRGTFYSNYEDVYSLADKIMNMLTLDMEEFNNNNSDYSSNGWSDFFYHIYDNKFFYQTYFKLGYNDEKIDLCKLSLAYSVMPENRTEYFTEFFRAGLNAIVKKWLANDCKESPEEMAEIFASECLKMKS